MAKAGYVNNSAILEFLKEKEKKEEASEIESPSSSSQPCNYENADVVADMARMEMQEDPSDPESKKPEKMGPKKKRYHNAHAITAVAYENSAALLLVNDETGVLDTRSYASLTLNNDDVPSDDDNSSGSEDDYVYDQPYDDSLFHGQGPPAKLDGRQYPPNMSKSSSTAEDEQEGKYNLLTMPPKIHESRRHTKGAIHHEENRRSVYVEKLPYVALDQPAPISPVKVSKSLSSDTKAARKAYSTPEPINYEWYHGPLSRTESHRIFQARNARKIARNGDFLLRKSLNEDNLFVVVLFFDGAIFHNRVERGEDGQFLYKPMQGKIPIDRASTAGLLVKKLMGPHSRLKRPLLTGIPREEQQTYENIDLAADDKTGGGVPL